MNLELVKAGVLPIDIKFADREKYYTCFDTDHLEGRNPDRLSRFIAGYGKERRGS